MFEAKGHRKDSSHLLWMSWIGSPVPHFGMSKCLPCIVMRQAVPQEYTATWHLHPSFFSLTVIPFLFLQILETILTCQLPFTFLNLIWHFGPFDPSSNLFFRLPNYILIHLPCLVCVFVCVCGYLFWKIFLDTWIGSLSSAFLPWNIVLLFSIHRKWQMKLFFNLNPHL